MQRESHYPAAQKGKHIIVPLYIWNLAEDFQFDFKYDEGAV